MLNLTCLVTDALVSVSVNRHLKGMKNIIKFSITLAFLRSAKGFNIYWDLGEQKHFFFYSLLFFILSSNRVFLIHHKTMSQVWFVFVPDIQVQVIIYFFSAVLILFLPTFFRSIRYNIVTGKTFKKQHSSLSSPVIPSIPKVLTP